MGAVVEREIELPRIADSSRALVCIGVLALQGDLAMPSICDDTIRAVFIRAPIVTKVGSEVQVLATLDTGEVVMVRQGNCLAARNLAA